MHAADGGYLLTVIIGSRAAVSLMKSTCSMSSSGLHRFHLYVDGTPSPAAGGQNVVTSRFTNPKM